MGKSDQHIPPNAGPESGPFISYSRTDQSFVRKLHEALVARGRKSWVDWVGILPTEEWMEKVREAIDAAEALVFVLSPDSVQSRICREEIDHAAAQNKRLVPIVYREVDPASVHSALAKLNWIFIRDSDPFEDKVDELLGALDLDLDWIRNHSRLLLRAKDWHQRNEDASRLLRGRDLRDAEIWLSEVNQPMKREATPLQTRYIVASRQAETKRINFQRLLGVSAVVVLGALTIFAWKQRNEAQAQLKVAVSRQLAMRSLNIPETAVMQRLLVSTLATRYSHTSEADARLGEALRQSVPLRTTLWCPQSGNAMTSIAFHRGGEVAAGNNEKGVTVWSVSTGRVLAFRASEDAVDAVSFGPDEKRVAIADEGRVILWEWESGREQQLGGEPNGRTSLAAFSEEGTSVYLASAGKLTEWEIKSGQARVLVEAQVPTDNDTYAFNDTATRFAQAEANNKIKVWDLATLKPIAELAGAAGPGLKLAFANDGKTLAAGDYQSALVWDLEPNEPRLVNRLEDVQVYSLSFTPDGTGLAISDSKVGIIRQWDFRKRSQKWPLAAHHSNAAVRWHPAGQLLASSGSGGAVYLWQPAQQHTHILQEHDAIEPVSELCSSNGRMLVLRRGKGYSLWDRQGKSPEIHLEDFPTPPGPPERIKFSQRGRLLVLLENEQTFGFWNTETGRRLPSLQTLEFWPGRFAVSPTDSSIAAIDSSGKLVAWKLSDRTAWSQNPENTGIANCLGFSADGKWLASGGLEGPLIVWNAATGKPEFKLGPEVAKWSALAFSGDGRRLASATGSAIWIWDLKSKSLQRKMLGHTAPMTSLAFSPDGRMLASGGLDKSAILWDLRSGEIILKVEDKQVPGDVLGLAFSTDGKLLATRGPSGSVQLWNIDFARWTKLACSIINRNLRPDEWETYLPSQPYLKLCPDLPAEP